jgi:uncharacterized phage-associated protein
MNERPIRFRFNAKKAAQAANKLLQLSGGQRNYMELVKLLYLADRKAIVRLQRQITGDQLVSLPYGPVLSRILNLIRLGPNSPEDAPWFDAVSAPFGYDVKSLGDCGDDELSNAECRILQEVYDEHGGKNWKELSKLTHELPEWTDPDGGTIPISPEQVLKLEGKSPEEIAFIRRELSLFDQLDRELSRYEGQEFVVCDQLPA